MEETDSNNEPDWDTPLSITVTPGWLIHALFSSASSVHTGWSSCVDSALIVSDTIAADDRNGNYCRLVEQEFSEGEGEDTVWHDWGVEIRVGEMLITGHWQIPASTSPMEWDWCSREAEQAFEKACVLFGRRVRRGLLIEEPDPQNAPPKQKHH